MSVDWPNLPTFPAGESAGLSGVHTGPGATALTRMPLSIRFDASDLVNAWIAPLVD
jgi:hypothetical protein